MSELAFNINGEAFDVPPTASGWRVKRMKPKGAPEVVYGRDGLPLVLPIDAEVADLRREVDIAGRYRLDLVDANNRTLPETPAGYVQVVLEPTAEPIVYASAPNNTVTLEAMRLNAELARSVIERFPQMMEAAAILLRAADGAGLPARPGMVEPIDDEEEAEPTETEQPQVDLASVITQLVPVAMSILGEKKVPKLAEVLDWRKAQPKDNPAQPAPPGATLTDRFRAIQAQLSPQEQLLAVTMAKELSDTDRTAWMQELAALDVADAVTRIRKVLAGATGGVS